MEAKQLIGTMPREDIAKTVGTSVSSLKRAFRGVRLAYFNKYVINPDLVKQVCAYYEKHGKLKTQNQFPKVCVRSVVERYKWFKPRQTRWTASQIVEAVKMSGIVSFDNQAKYFKRPNANAGAIRSLWMKRFGFGSNSIHGMPQYISKELVNPKCPFIPIGFFKIALWSDMEKHMKSDNPKFIKDAISTMAEFQRWLFNSKNPKAKLLEIKRCRNK